MLTKNLHPRQGLLDSLPEQSKEPFIFHQLGAVGGGGGGLVGYEGGGEEKTWLWLLKGGSVAL